MKRPIAYYVHHHGNGHLQRALAIAAHAAGRIVLIGTGLDGHTGNISCLDLPDDRVADFGFDGKDGALNRPIALHYAPLDHEGVRRRTSMVASWIAHERPVLFVSDVSVEMAMLARLCATPVVYIRLSGRRDDAAHLEAFRASKALIAPFDCRLDDPDVEEWIRQKTTFCPGIVQPVVRKCERVTGTILVVMGKGGQGADGDALAEVARSMPDKKWRIIGPCSQPDSCPQNLEIAGWVDDPEPEIARADVVIGAAGDGLIGLVIAAARPFICIPEDRPYNEQRQKAAALARNRVAVVVERWPATENWATILDSAKMLDLQRLSSFGNSHGAEMAWRRLEAIADR